MRKLILSLWLLPILLLHTAVAAYAQKIKYKDLAEQLAAGDTVGAYPMLKKYYRTDTSFAPAAMQLGLIFSKRGRSFDPLRENEKAITFCDSALFYLSKAYSAIDEKEFKKNRDYYAGFKYGADSVEIKDREAHYAFLKTSLLSRMQSDSAHRRHIDTIYRAFEAMVNHYARARAVYARLNGQHATVKQMLLSEADSLLPALRIMATHYDSSLFFQQKYTASKREYDLPAYRQVFDVPQPIEIFRLDGLDNTDFLADKVPTWDYADWARSMVADYTSDITGLRRQIIAADKKLEEGTALARRKQLAQNRVNDYRIPAGTLLMMDKYEYNSVVAELLRLKETVFLLEMMRAHDLYADAPCSLAEFDKRSEHLKQLNRMLAAGDSMNAAIMAQDLAARTDLHREYITSSYTNLKGLKAYLESNASAFKRSRAEARMMFTSLIKNKVYEWCFSENTVNINGISMPMRWGAVPGGAATILQIEEDMQGRVYMAGVLSARAVPFIACVERSGALLWFHQMEPGGPLLRFSHLDARSSALTAVVAQAPDSSGPWRTYLIRLSAGGGKVLLKKELAEPAPAVGVVFDDISESFAIAYQSTPADPARLVYYDRDAKITEQFRFACTGQVVDMKKVFGGQVLVVNGTWLDLGMGKTYGTPTGGESRVWMIKHNAGSAQASVKEVAVGKNSSTLLRNGAEGVLGLLYNPTEAPALCPGDNEEYEFLMFE